MQLLKEALNGIQCDRRVRTTDRTGWLGNVFVLPHKTIGLGAEEIIFRSSVFSAHYAEEGTLDEWRSAVAAPAKGNSRILFALSAAFAGPVFDALEEEPIGVNFFGHSSTGKSTALAIAGSVWGGGGRNGFAQTWHATRNGLEPIAKAHSGTCLCLDELGEIDARAASEYAYGLMNGTGKSRADRSGEARRKAEYRVNILSSGEISMADKILEAGARARQGQSVRFVDVPADGGKGLGIFDETHGQPPGEVAVKLKNAAFRIYGTAGPALIESLSRDLLAALDRIRIDAKKAASDWLPAGADGQICRVAHRFALIGAAGDLAAETLGLPWDKSEALDAAKACFAAWLDDRGGAQQGEIMDAIKALRDVITESGEMHFPRLANELNDNASLKEEGRMFAV